MSNTNINKKHTNHHGLRSAMAGIREIIAMHDDDLSDIKNPRSIFSLNLSQKSEKPGGVVYNHQWAGFDVEFNLSNKKGDEYVVDYNRPREICIDISVVKHSKDEQGKARVIIARVDNIKDAVSFIQNMTSETIEIITHKMGANDDLSQRLVESMGLDYEESTGKRLDGEENEEYYDDALDDETQYHGVGGYPGYGGYDGGDGRDK